MWRCRETFGHGVSFWVFFFINLTFAQLLFECLVVRLRRSLSVACRITKIVAGFTRVRLQSLSLLTGMSDNMLADTINRY